MINVHRILKKGGFFIVDHCNSEWGKGFHSIENYEMVKDKLKDFENKVAIDRIINVKGRKKKVSLTVIPYSEKQTDELIEEITSLGFKYINKYLNDTESFGKSSLIIFKKE